MYGLSVQMNVFKLLLLYIETSAQVFAHAAGFAFIPETKWCLHEQEYGTCVFRSPALQHRLL